MSMLQVTPEQKPAILAALYNASRPIGMGFLQYTATKMTPEEAADILEAASRGRCYFDYLKGRVMKMDFSTDELDFRLYDRDNGEGAGLRAALAVSR